jgi:hypothetical protein
MQLEGICSLDWAYKEAFDGVAGLVTNFILLFYTAFCFLLLTKFLLIIKEQYDSLHFVGLFCG